MGITGRGVNIEQPLKTHAHAGEEQSGKNPNALTVEGHIRLQRE
jgi:hypothetical protein